MSAPEPVDSPAIHHPVTIEAAAVTIRVLHVATKPMTISVYNQLPQSDRLALGDRLVGWINRHPFGCPNPHSDGHIHVLAVRDDEPRLVDAWTDPGRMLRSDVAEARKWGAHLTEVGAESPTRYGYCFTCYRQQTHDEHRKFVQRSYDFALASGAEIRAWIDNWHAAVTALPQLYIAR